MDEIQKKNTKEKIKMIKDIIETLGTTVNFHRIIKLSEKYDEININEYLHLCPDININFEYTDKIDSGFYTRNIQSLKSFRLKDNVLYTDINLFIKNIHDVVEMSFRNKIFSVVSGKYHHFDNDYRSIEFDLHNIKEASINNTFSLYGIIITEKEHKSLIRQAKYNKFNGNSKSLKELVKDLRVKKYDVLWSKRKEKREEANYSFYNDEDDDFSKLIISAC